MVPKNDAKVIDKVFSWLDKYGRFDDGILKEDRVPVLLDAMDQVLRESYQTTLDGLMQDSRTDKNILLRTYCYATYKKHFPSHGQKQIAQAFGNKKDRVTIYYLLSGFPYRLRTEERVKREYTNFDKAIEDKLSHNQQQHADNPYLWPEANQSEDIPYGSGPALDSVLQPDNQELPQDAAHRVTEQ